MASRRELDGLRGVMVARALQGAQLVLCSLGPSYLKKQNLPPSFPFRDGLLRAQSSRPECLL